MAAYTEHRFVQALVPLLISRLPDPLSPNEVDMLNVANAASLWAELLVDLRADPYWMGFLLDDDENA
jgi:hypothetical protein